MLEPSEDIPVDIITWFDIIKGENSIHNKRNKFFFAVDRCNLRNANSRKAESRYEQASGK